MGDIKKSRRGVEDFQVSRAYRVFAAEVLMLRPAGPLADRARDIDHASEGEKKASTDFFPGKRVKGPIRVELFTWICQSLGTCCGSESEGIRKNSGAALLYDLT